MAESGIIEVKAKSEGQEEVSVSYDFGKDLDDMVDKFGKDIVFTNARAQMKIKLQANMRTWMSAEPPRDVAAMAAMWKPGAVVDRALDPVTVAKNYVATLATPEEKAAFLEQIKSAL